MDRQTIQGLGLLVVMAYIAVAVFGLLPMTGIAHDMTMQGVDCPYTTGMQSFCNTGFSHIRGWQTFSNGITSQFELSLILALVFVSFLPLARTVLASGLFVRLRKRSRHIPRTIYQELFSQGILNPKNP